jgi:hypothetical protein
MLKKWVLTFTVCGFEMTCWALCGVETNTCGVKLLLQLLLCGFDICLFLFDRTAKIDPTEVSTCRGSFGGFKSTCFQLDRAARIESTGISYFSCDRSPSLIFAASQQTC